MPIRDKAAFIDWVIVVSILSQVGIVNLHGYNGDHRDLAEDYAWSYKVDDDGRITSLCIHGDEEDLFDLPAGIVRLEMLIYISKSTTVDLFPRRNYLVFYICSHHFIFNSVFRSFGELPRSDGAKVFEETLCPWFSPTLITVPSMGGRTIAEFGRYFMYWHEK